MTIGTGTKATLAAVALFASVSAANADCFVKNTDDKGWFTGNYSTTFNGNSAKTIWDKYCKPYIQEKIASNDIRNGKFGMKCTGSLSCNIQGTIKNGRLRMTRTHGL